MTKYLVVVAVLLAAIACSGPSANPAATDAPRLADGEATAAVHDWIASKDQTLLPEGNCLLATQIVLDDPLWQESWQGEGTWLVTTTASNSPSWIVTEKDREVTRQSNSTSPIDQYCD
ncbi:MAG: hypothetical protein ACE5Q6_21795 [Dehalococcoidia bacterium]